MAKRYRKYGDKCQMKVIIIKLLDLFKQQIQVSVPCRLMKVIPISGSACDVADA